MEKEKRSAFGKEIYLLGSDENGTKYWLEEASWDCDWYWGFGYIETYTNNNCPERSRDINSHEHYDTKILKNGVCTDDFKKIFKNTPLNNNEIWKLNELMETFYTLKKTSALYYRGSSNITKNDLSSSIKNDDEYKRINKEIMPKLFEEVYKILSTNESEGE